MTAKKSFFTRTAAFLTALLLMLAAIAVAPFGELTASAKNAAKEAGVSLASVSIKKITQDGDAVDLKEGDSVRNNDKLTIQIKWLLSNTEFNIDETTSFSWPLETNNLKISDNFIEGTFSLDNAANTTVGTYRIENDRIYIDITNPEPLKDLSQRYIMITVEALIDFKENEVSQGEEIDVSIAEENVSVTAITSASRLDVTKSKTSVPYLGNDDEIYLDYEIKATVVGSYVEDITLADVPADGWFSAPELVSVEVKTGGSEMDYTRSSSLEPGENGSFSMRISGKFVEGTEIIIRYKVKMDKKKFLETNTSWAGFDNRANFTYTDDTEKQGSSSAYDGGSFTNGPKVTKTYKTNPQNLTKDNLDEDTEIEWTITIEPGIYEKLIEAKKDSIKIEDFLGENMVIVDPPELKNKLENLKLSDFTKDGNGNYVFTYKTKPAPATTDNNQTITFTNSVNVSGIEEGVTLTDSKTITVWGESPISKSFIQVDPDGYMDWSLDVYIGSGSYDVAKITDNPSSNISGKTHKLLPGSVEIETSKGKVSVDSGHIVDNNNGSFTINLLPYIGDIKNETVTITYKTEPLLNGQFDEDAFSDKYHYYNRSTFDYTVSSKPDSASDDAVYRDSFEDIAKKSSDTNNGTFPITWWIELKNDTIRSYPDGDVLVLKDKIPEHLIFDEARGVTFIRSRYDSNVIDLSKYQEKNFYEYDPKTNILTITIKFNKAFRDELNKNWGDPALCYYTRLNPEDTDWFFEQAPNTWTRVRFTNNVSITHNGEYAGNVSSNADVTRGNVLSKRAEYSSAMNSSDKDKYDDTHVASYGKLNVFYSVDINPGGYLLSSSGTLQAIDKMGKDLQLIPSSVKVFNAATNKEIDDYTMSFDPEKNIVTYTLPDGVPLRLEYYAYILADVRADLSKLDVNNTIELIAKEQTSSSASIKNNGKVLASYGTAGSEGWSISIYKYTQLETDKFEVLPGAEFTLDAVNYDSVNKKWNVISGKSKTGRSDANGEIFFEGLEYDYIYRLTETAAPNGYTAQTNEYYFVLAGQTGVTIPPGVTVNKVKHGQMIPVLNVSEFSLEKKYEDTNLAGLTKAQREALMNATEFTISKVGGEVSDPVTVTWDSAGKRAKVSFGIDLETGSIYKISETKTPAGFQKSKDMYVKVEADGKVSYTYDDPASATAKWTKTDYNNVVVTNKRIKTKISKIDITNSKEIAGAVLRIDAQGDARIIDAAGTGLTTFSWTSENGKSKELTLTAGTYILTETTAPNGYGVVETKVKFTVTTDASGNVTVEIIDYIATDGTSDSSPETTAKFDVTGESGKNDTLVIKDSPVDDIEIIKHYDDPAFESMTPAERDALLKATEFTLTDKSSGAQVKKSPVWDEEKERAVVKFSGSDLKNNRTYELKETTIPSGYAGETRTLVCKIDKAGKVTYSFSSGPAVKYDDVFDTLPVLTNIKINVELIKQYSDEDGKILDNIGADVLEVTKFALFSDQACQTRISLDAEVVNDNGTYKVIFNADNMMSGRKLEAGKTYYMKETRSPSGYVKSDAIFKCEISSSGAVTYSIVNTSSTTGKIDDETGFPICTNVIRDLKNTDKIKVEITKKWLSKFDGSTSAPDGVRSIYVDITYAGNPLENNLEISASDSWKYSYEYTYDELGITGEGAVFDPDSLVIKEKVGRNDNYTPDDIVVNWDDGTATASAEVTNRYGSEPVPEISLTLKKDWLDSAGKPLTADKIPTYKVTLNVFYKNTLIDSVEVSSIDNWETVVKYTAKDARFNGMTITEFKEKDFKVTEFTDVSGFTSTSKRVDETFTVTNKEGSGSTSDKNEGSSGKTEDEFDSSSESSGSPSSSNQSGSYTASGNQSGGSGKGEDVSSGARIFGMSDIDSGNAVTVISVTAASAVIIAAFAGVFIKRRQGRQKK